MFPSPDKQLPGFELLLEMTLKTEILVPLDQHLVVHRPMRIMAGGAPFPHRFMLEYERAALRDMAGAASIALGV